MGEIEKRTSGELEFFSIMNIYDITNLLKMQYFARREMGCVL